MKENRFVIRTYGLQELAKFYFPDVDSRHASKQFRKWLAYGKLHDRLAKVGYYSRQRVFTPKQVAIIVDVLGKPQSII